MHTNDISNGEPHWKPEYKTLKYKIKEFQNPLYLNCHARYKEFQDKITSTSTPKDYYMHNKVITPFMNQIFFLLIENIFIEIILFIYIYIYNYKILK